MPRRTQVFTKIPWNGGINSTVDAGVLPDNDLVQADDIQFATSGARIKREGLDFFDAPSVIPNVITRSSTGTTRTLVFDATLTISTNDKLVVGEKITVTSTGGETDYEGNFTVATITTTTLSNDTITYIATGVLAEGATATSTITLTRNFSIIGLHDFWYLPAGTIAKVQLLIAVADDGKIFKYDNTGRRVEIDLAGGATALTSPSNVAFEVVNNKLIMGFDGATNVPKIFDPIAILTDFSDLTNVVGDPPNFSVMRQHLGRLFTNDKDRPDRLHYSSPGNPEEWQGQGDSGGRDVFPGDGDPEGIIAIMPPFKGRLFISKKFRIFEVLGDTPEGFTFDPITNGLGALSHNAAVAVDLDDLMFMSNKGFHSLVATAAHGDFEGKFLSQKIQNDFNSFEPASLKFSDGAYIPDLNSIAFSITPDGDNKRSEVWFFNTLVKEWFKWPSRSSQALTIRLVNERVRKLVLGTDDGRIVQAQNGTFTDFGTSGPSYTIKTGVIYVDGSPETIKMFKRLKLYFKPKGDFSFTAKVQIDNQAEQTLTFTQGQNLDLLGSTFILGTSILGNDDVLAPEARPIEGEGRGITLTVTSSGTQQPVEIYGYSIEFEGADINQETL